MAHSRTFWNLFAKKYAQQPVPDQAVYDRKLEQTQALMRPDMSVLEFGCGTGTTSLIHAPYVARIDAIDYAPEMIKIANAKKGTTSNVHFHVSTLDDWQAQDAEYDMILGMSILHLLPNRAAALDRVYRLLKPGGHFLSSTVCIGDMSRWVRAFIPIGSALRVIPNVSSFSAAQLNGELKAAGFHIEDCWRPKPDADIFHVCRKPD